MKKDGRDEENPGNTAWEDPARPYSLNQCQSSSSSRRRPELTARRHRSKIDTNAQSRGDPPIEFQSLTDEDMKDHTSSRTCGFQLEKYIGLLDIVAVNGAIGHVHDGLCVNQIQENSGESSNS